MRPETIEQDLQVWNHETFYRLMLHDRIFRQKVVEQRLVNEKKLTGEI